ncbi:MAG: hypothetical protein PHE27_01270 [Alphaproteobacteria bacterium]|nr:hypothetical protein [Alphaproteobacteria bacterium]
MSSVDSPVDFLLLVASLTPRKTKEYETLVANANIKGHVAALNDFEEFHSPVEDEDSLAKNLAKKESEAEKAVKRFRKGGRDHASFMKRVRESGIEFKGGLATAMDRIVVMVDDTTTAIPKDIWFAMLPELKKLVVPDSLKASECHFKEEIKEYMCVADIGPITSSIGQEGFWRLVAKTADNITDRKGNYVYRGKPIKVYDQVSCAFRRIGAPEEAPFKTVYAHRPLYVYRPPKNYTPPEKILRSEHFLCPPDTPTTPVYKRYGTYLLKQSMRKSIVDQMHTILMPELKNVRPHALTKQEFAQAAKETTPPHPRTVVVFTDHTGTLDAAEYGLSGYNVKKILLPGNGKSFEELNKKETLTKALSLNFSFGNADALLFLPFDHNNDELRAYNNLMIRSAHVAEALNSCYHHTPMIVVNKNGCFDGINESHYAGALGGYNKDFNRHPIHDGLQTHEKIVSSTGIEHESLYYMDVLTVGDSGCADAIEDILKFRFKKYHHISRNKPRDAIIGGEERPEDLFGTTIFASASSDKKIDWDIGKELGRFLGRHDIALCTGGGDQHLMYAPIEGYEETRTKGKSHLSCVSTHDIVYVETAYGHLPECDYWELHEDIGPRIETLMRSQMLISIGGGDGTEQEIAYAALKMKYLSTANEANAGKTLLFVGQDPAMLAGIKCIVGDKDFKRMQKNPYALGDKGIYYAPHADAAKLIILRAKHQFMENKKSVTPMQRPAHEQAVPAALKFG